MREEHTDHNTSPGVNRPCPTAEPQRNRHGVRGPLLRYAQAKKEDVLGRTNRLDKASLSTSSG